MCILTYLRYVSIKKINFTKESTFEEISFKKVIAIFRKDLKVNVKNTMIGIIPENGEYYIMTQGNESKRIVCYEKMLRSFFALDIQIENINHLTKVILRKRA